MTLTATKQTKMNAEVAVETPYLPRDVADVFDITSEAASGLGREPSHMTAESYNSETPGSEVFGELVSSINYKRSVFSFNNKKKSQFSGLDTDTVDDETEEDSRSECHDAMKELHNTVNCLIKERRASIESVESLPVEIIKIASMTSPKMMELVASPPTACAKNPNNKTGSVSNWSLCSLPMEELQVPVTEFGAVICSGTSSENSSSENSSLAAEVVELPATQLFCPGSGLGQSTGIPLSKTLPPGASLNISSFGECFESTNTTPEDPVLSPSFLKDKNAIARYGSCILAHCALVEEEGSAIGSPTSPLSLVDWSQQDGGGGPEEIVMICDLPIQQGSSFGSVDSLEPEILTFG